MKKLNKKSTNFGNAPKPVKQMVSFRLTSRACYLLGMLTELEADKTGSFNKTATLEKLIRVAARENKLN